MRSREYQQIDIKAKYEKRWWCDRWCCRTVFRRRWITRRPQSLFIIAQRRRLRKGYTRMMKCLPNRRSLQGWSSFPCERVHKDFVIWSVKSFSDDTSHFWISGISSLSWNWSSLSQSLFPFPSSSRSVTVVIVIVNQEDERSFNPNVIQNCRWRERVLYWKDIPTFSVFLPLAAQIASNMDCASK